METDRRVILQLSDVLKIYRIGEIKIQAIRGVTLAIERGEFIAILGSSGSGKSTLMNLLGCLDRLTEGSYLLDGADVSKMTPDELAGIRNQKIGFVFQNFNLLASTSALENVELPLLYGSHHGSSLEFRRKALEALERVGLGDRAEHHPSQLSGGQQQRVAIARALIQEPEIILADEPTGNLDTRTSLEIMDVLQKLNDQGITIVIVTHELDIAAFAKRNIFMRDGKVFQDAKVSHRSLAVEKIREWEATQAIANL